MSLDSPSWKQAAVVLYDKPPNADMPGIKSAIDNGRPEDIPGIVQGKPDFSAAGHKIVRTFSIDRKKRLYSACIPCSICSVSHPKFLEGALLWSPDKHLRLIGHQCAAKNENFGRLAYDALIAKKKQEALDDASLTWLEVNLANISAIREAIDKSVELAIFLEKHRLAFFRDVRTLAEYLENVVRKHDGKLTVVEEISKSQQRIREASPGLKSSRYDTTTFGALEGGAFVCRPRRKVSD